ncbi:hypothetical protein [Alicyclobacillus shizuokensis]|uniref:hypothetical protein n=1 Tax=Alicyclobacillus shizuokensis TaxID=392014 RepID=UPI000837148C|nr:hypothetical protein [Alicyclobacillus shizuokensis]
MTRGRMLGVACLVVLAVWLCLSMLASWRRQPAEAVQSKPHSTVGRLFVTDRDWHGRPVYRLQNESHQTLHHVRLQSLAGDSLPILAITARGQTAPSLLTNPLAQPPYTLPSGACAWFVGPKRPPLQIVLYWQDPDGNIRHEFDAFPLPGVH